MHRLLLSSIAGLCLQTLAAGSTESGDPLLSSWLTANSSKYARIYEDASAKSSGTTSTTWTITNSMTGNDTTQADPVYADVQAIRYTADWVYVEASGLGSHVMGPWAAVNGSTFTAYPVNQSYLRRLPRNPVSQSGIKDMASGPGTGLLVNGVSTWGAVDSSSWDGSDLVRGGNFNTATYYWHQCAPPAEDFNFDDANGHQPPSGTYHVHQNPIALRYQLGDNVDYDAATKEYTDVLDTDGGFNGQHSPIIGWAHDGFPIYGPYAYDDPDILGGTVRRMVPGFVKRDGNTAGVDNVITNNSTLPAWYARFREDQFGESYSTTAPDSRSTNTGTYPVGQFAQDWEHLADVAAPIYTQGTHYDLDQYGGRVCKTPEYPDGIYCYFTPIDASAEPVFPFIMGFEYYGDATGGDTNNTNGSTVCFLGGPHADLDLETPSAAGGDVTVVWNSVEGGTYEILQSDTNSNFTSVQSGIAGTGDDLTEVFADADGAGFAQVTRTGLATYDEVLSSVPSSTQTGSEAYSTPVTVWYVDAGETGNVGQDGTSWATAFADLQDALFSAASGDQVWVANGVYYPDEAEAGVAEVIGDNRGMSFGLPDGVAIYGGFTGTTETQLSERDPEANVAILSGDIDQNDNTVDGIIVDQPDKNIGGGNAYQVVTGNGVDSSAVLDGFTITAGKADGDHPQDHGAAIYCVGGTPTVASCAFQGNQGGYGTCYFEFATGTLSLSDSDIVSNVAEVGGAGLILFDVDAAVDGCQLLGNRSTSSTFFGFGNALYAVESSLALSNTLISGNSSNSGSTVRCDRETEDGLTTIITNCTIAGNYVDGNSGAAIAGVVASSSIQFEIHNSILWGNISDTGSNDSVLRLDTQTYSLIEGESPSGNGNLDGTDASNDPVFTNPIYAAAPGSAGGDYRLSGNSPALDIGSNALASGFVDDLAGNTRILDSTVDFGAYEYDGPRVVNPLSVNTEVPASAEESVLIATLADLFGSGDYTFTFEVLQKPFLGDFGWDSGPAPTTFLVEPPFGSLGVTAGVTLTATDASGASVSYTFTVELVEAAATNDLLAANLSSWYTERSSRYARIYELITDEQNGTPVTTWSHGAGEQALPVYGGVQEISYSDDWVYIKTSGLGNHIMGPWYNDEAKTTLFGSYPANTAVLWRVPITPVIPQTKTGTTPGAIGYFVDGVAMFDSTDTYSYNNANAADARPNTDFTGDGVWNRDAYVNEGTTFDNANAHQAGAEHHYHANPPGLRHLIGDSVDLDEATNVYTENFDDEHSPILGWVKDGLPIYGPYGYGDALDPDSTVRRMISGYQKRDGTYGSTDLDATGRDSLPDWIVSVQGRSLTVASDEEGPDVSAGFPLGHYLEDYAYKGDLGLTQGIDFDLTEFNVRWCVTPEFPSGTWAYFVNIEPDGTPAFPYNISMAFWGDPVSESVSTIDETVTVQFEGGINKALREAVMSEGPEVGDLTLVWSAVEGGNYRVEATPDLEAWSDLVTTTATTDSVAIVDEGILDSSMREFYKLTLDSVEPYDTTEFGGGGGGNTGGGGGGIFNVSPNTGADDETAFVVTFEFDPAADPPAPPAAVAPDTVTLGGVAGSGISRDGTSGVVTATFNLTSLAVGDYDLVASFSPPEGGSIDFTGADVFAVTAAGGGGGGTVSFEFTYGTMPPLPMQAEIQSTTVGGVTATIIAYDPGAGTATFEFDSAPLAPGSYNGVITFTPTMGPQAGNQVNINSTNMFTVSGGM